MSRKHQPTPSSEDESTDEVNEIAAHLFGLGEDTAKSGIMNSIAYEDYVNRFLSLLAKREAEARIAGFKDAQIACSFNKDCNNCEANRLTLAYLGQPDFFATTNPSKDKE